MNKVLIIDDDEVDFMIYSRIIKLGKFSEYIIHQESAESGIEYLRNLQNPEEWPTHILVDINMRGKSGFDFVSLFDQLSSPQKKSTKIFMVSASDNGEDKKRAQSMDSIKGFITKPLSIEEAQRLFSGV